MNTHTPQHELHILNTIHQNEDATQRELSEKVGLSLGAINLIIKKLTKKGLIKVVRLQPNSIKYFLTPEGIADKIERTSQYIAKTYREVMSLQIQITQALEGLITEENRESILFYGPDDEIKVMVTKIAKEEFNINHDHIITDLDDLKRMATRQGKAHVLTWNTECEQLMNECHIHCTNIMHRVIV